MGSIKHIEPINDNNVMALSYLFFQIVLAACSKFFAEIFSANGIASDRSFVVLEDIRAQDFKNLLHFMYHGQVNIDKEDLDR